MIRKGLVFLFGLGCTILLSGCSSPFDKTDTTLSDQIYAKSVADMEAAKRELSKKETVSESGIMEGSAESQTNPDTIESIGEQ